MVTRYRNRENSYLIWKQRLEYFGRSVEKSYECKYKKSGFKHKNNEARFKDFKQRTDRISCG